jgi:predicted ATP-dependent endonuclease of OLD family
MKLTFFSIENYRSIAKAQFKKLSNVAILVGPNNEGKSNVLQALRTCLFLVSNSQYTSWRFRTEGKAVWPAPGFEDTEFGVLMEPEVAEVYTRVQA